ncbi:MAG: hybrid sensor histidine kinase/response regulator [Sphingobacteriales bacterium]|nr:MAG: hybrid sensor histidine kinase/response regulator [Sphingobacteriales bacterium]
MRDAINTSVLVIDDEEIVRDNIEEILAPKHHAYHDEEMDLAASILFDDAPNTIIVTRKSNIPNFEVSKAPNGMEGVDMVRKAIAAGKPYAVIFLDMRMPGWDGLETAMEIRKYDKQVEIIFITAFSDRSIDEIVSKAGQNVGYHCKPYASEEIMQLATKAVTDYAKLRNLESLMDAIASLSLKEHQLQPLLRNILDQLTHYIGSDMAVLGKLHADDVYEKVYSVGAVDAHVNIEELVSLVRDRNLASEEVIQYGEVVLARMENYAIFALLEGRDKLKTEKLYLLRLFVQSAAKAIRNAELNEKLLQQEKLSAIGSAVGMVIHDLRSPINNISMLTEMMRSEGYDSELLNMVDQCGVQASEIFNDFMDFIKGASIKKQSVNLNDIVDNAIRVAKAHHEDAIRILMYQDVPDNIVLGGDESKLKRCIINLLTNAVDVLLAYRVANPRIDVRVWPDKEYENVNITIYDNGPGIPEQIIRNVFEPFVTSQKTGGTGLGLAIVKQYITAHGGTIAAENEHGALFHITLPTI